MTTVTTDPPAYTIGIVRTALGFCTGPTHATLSTRAIIVFVSPTNGEAPIYGAGRAGITIRVIRTNRGHHRDIDIE